ncbi:Fur-regulated basic protein FbpA [Bacillus sp. CGMCC 1.16607]|uniref:Fur-regulated basic protein FbpA n=1 Tax=Bacillus sp. CGMCC 1.16607 TaxID=3351842 RepID=UPI00362BFD36
MNIFRETEEETKKEFLINELLEMGIFKSRNLQLFELSLAELEEEYQKFRGS